MTRDTVVSMARYLLKAFAWFLIALGSPLARAQAIPSPATTAPPTSQPESKREPLWLLPLKLSGKTEGEETAKIGAGVRYSVGDLIDLATVLDYEVSTEEGVARLLGVTGSDVEQPSQWSLGLTFSLFKLTSAEPNLAIDGPAEAAFTEAFNNCVKRCDSQPSKKDEKTFCEDRTEKILKAENTWLSSLKPDDFCEEGKAQAQEASALADAAKTAKLREALAKCESACKDGKDCKPSGKPRELDLDDFPIGSLCELGKEKWFTFEKVLRRIFPPLMANAGFRVGHAEFTYREKTGTPVTLPEHEVSRTPWSAGATVTGLLRGEPGTLTTVLQGIAVFESKWTASPNKVEWCSPVGDVPIDEDSPAFDPSAPSAPGRICDKAALGPPTHTPLMRLGASIGGVDEAEGKWRFSMGPEVSLKTSKFAVQDINLRIAIYRDVTTEGRTLDYKGLLRITPTFGFARQKDGKFETQAFLEFALLGERSLFLNEFDDL